MSKEVERIKKADLEVKVKAYAKNHPGKNLLVHGGPVAAMSLATLGGSLIGLAPVFVTIVLTVGLLWFFMGAKSFNAKAIAAANSPEAELAEKEEKLAALESNIKSFVDSKDVVRAEPLSEYDCPNYEQVTWDMKLVDEKIIPLTDVSVCDLAKCFLCEPIKIEQAKEVEALRKAEIARRQAEFEKNMREVRQRQEKRATESDARLLAGMSDVNAERVRAWHSSLFNNPDFSKVEVDHLLDSAKINFAPKTAKSKQKVIQCPEHDENRIVETWFYGLCPEHRLEQLLESDRLAAARRKAEAAAAKKAAVEEKERLFQERRKVDVMGVNILRPMEVPEGAVPSILHGKDLDMFATHSYVVWKWTENGKDTLFYKQPIAIDSYSVSSAHGVIKTFYSAHDAETGEYLGDYSNTVESEKMKYHNKLMQDVKVFNK